MTLRPVRRRNPPVVVVKLISNCAVVAERHEFCAFCLSVTTDGSAEDGSEIGRQNDGLADEPPGRKALSVFCDSGIAALLIEHARGDQPPTWRQKAPRDEHHAIEL
jgi:hypothetical protein